MATKNRNSHFQSSRGGILEKPIYICRDCGRRTRETGHDESGVELCAFCFLGAVQENYLLNNECTQAEYDAEMTKLHARYNPSKEASLYEDRFATQSAVVPAPAQVTLTETQTALVAELKALLETNSLLLQLKALREENAALKAAQG